VDILTTVKSINMERNRPVDQTIEINIGIHAGPVILGTIGSPKRMDSTVLGLTVNLAKRIEEVTRHLGVEMLISEQVANQLSDRYVHKFRELGEVPVKGSSVPIGIIEVYDHDSPEVRHLKDQIEPIMSEGLEFLKGGHLDTAMLNFKKAQLIFPQDLPLRLLIASLQKTLEQGQAIQGSALLDFRSK
jgi:adenylate cyclase